MLTQAIASYLEVRRTCGFALKLEGDLLNSFGTFSAARGKDYVCVEIAIEWAGLARTITQRARRLGQVIRFARYARAEDQRHELPSAVFGRKQASSSMVRAERNVVYHCGKKRRRRYVRGSRCEAMYWCQNCSSTLGANQ